MNITPYKHQIRFAKTAPNRCGIWHGTGTGKTVTVLQALKWKGNPSTLIICPKGVKSKWQDMVKNFWPDITADCRVVTKEEFRRDWKHYGRYTAIVIDEAHHFSSTTSQLHKSLVKYIEEHSPTYIYPMTATPYRREPMNIYALARIVGLRWNYIGFRRKFYYEQYFGPRAVWLPKKGIEKEVAALVRQIGDVVSFSECGDMPPVKHKVEYVELTADQTRAIQELELTEANPLVYYGKEHQICSGIGAKSAKFDYIIDLCEQEPKIAVFCRYRAQMEEIEKTLKELEYTVFMIHGDVKDKSEVAKQVENTDKCVVIIQMDSAEGWELPSVNVAVFASMSYSYLAYEQSCGRFIRINKKNQPKLFIYLLTSKTIDEAVYKSLMKKQDFSIEIYAREKSLPTVSKLVKR